MRVLPDTSVWIDYLRRNAPEPSRELGGLLDLGQVVVCGPVTAELLGGMSDDRRIELWRMLASLPWIDLGPDDWRRVGEVSADLRRSGGRVPLTDVAIAVAAVAADAQLWTRDSDFDRIAAVLPELRRWATPDDR